MNEILKAIEIVKIAQKHHAETWAGMIGTSWERDDKRMKHNFLVELFAMMESGKVNPKRIDEIITTVKA